MGAYGECSMSLRPGVAAMSGWAGVDWSQAPSWATHWAVDGDGRAQWFGLEIVWSISVDVWLDDHTSIEAPDFGYTGHPRDSLTLRPLHGSTLNCAQRDKNNDAFFGITDLHKKAVVFPQKLPAQSTKEDV